MKVIVGTDQGGFEQRPQIIDQVKSMGHEVLDYGIFDSKSFDYPDIAAKVAVDVAKGVGDCGILMCGTGIGVSLAANKIKGIRAAVVNNTDYARLAKEHNNANIICLSGRFSTVEENKSYVKTYLETQFAGDVDPEEGSRHIRRVKKIMDLEG